MLVSRVRWWGSVALLIVAAATAALAPEAGAAKKAKPRSLQVALPAPGHIAIETLKMTVKGKSRRMPKGLRLKPRKLSSLPPSVRVLYARRTIRAKRKTTYALLLLTVNAVTAKASTMAVAAENGHKGGGGLLKSGKGGDKTLTTMAELALFFGSPVAANVIQQQQDELDEQARADEFVDFLVKLEAQQTTNADLASPQQVAKVGRTLTDLFQGVKDGRNGLVFEQPQGSDPNLDTGHYDDGHAFGWGVKTPAQELNVFANLAAFINGQVDQLVAQIEADMSADVNGDGAVAPPGQTIDTTIGAPVIK